MHETGVLREGEERTTGVKTDVDGPVAQIRGVVPAQIVMHCAEIETPAVPRIPLHQIILENSAPLGTQDVLLEIVSDRIEASIDAEPLQEIEISPNLSNALVVILVHRSGINSEISSHLVEVVARGSERHLASQTVPAQCRHRDLSLVHKSRHIVSINYRITCHLLPSEVVSMVRVSEVSRVKDVNIPLVDDLRH